MAYDEGVAQRTENVLGQLPGLVAKKMFGGVGYLVQGNMACGVHKDMLIVRVGPEAYEEALEKPYTRQFDMTGRPMRGWVMVESGGFDSDEDLGYWVDRGVEFALSLPPK